MEIIHSHIKRFRDWYKAHMLLSTTKEVEFTIRQFLYILHNEGGLKRPGFSVCYNGNKVEFCFGNGWHDNLQDAVESTDKQVDYDAQKFINYLRKQDHKKILKELSFKDETINQWRN